MQRSILGARPKEFEETGAYMERVAMKLRQFRISYDLKRWANICKTRYFQWTGHFARMGIYDPERFTSLIHRWRDSRWLEIQKRALKGAQVHAKRFHVFRWEQKLVNFSKRVGEHWTTIALQQSIWDAHTDSFLEMCSGSKWEFSVSKF